MNEQRRQAYHELIDALLICESEEEINATLNNHRELLDAEFVEELQKAAAILAERGDIEESRLLLDIAQEIAEILNATATPSPDEYEEFLIQVLRATADSRGKPQIVYPILQQNREKLNN